MFMLAASGFGDLWALKWSTHCRIENEERTAKLPYTLYGCF